MKILFRQKLYDFFMSLKEPDGSFRVAEHMEVDVRYGILVNNLNSAFNDVKVVSIVFS